MTAQDLIKTISDKLEELTTLEIITAVVAASSGSKGLEKAEILQDSSDVMCSIINLIEGDITTRIPESFIGDGKYQELRAFHLEREAQGHQIIQDNIKALEALLQFAINLGKGTAPPQPKNP